MPRVAAWTQEGRSEQAARTAGAGACAGLRRCSRRRAGRGHGRVGGDAERPAARPADRPQGPARLGRRHRARASARGRRSSTARACPTTRFVAYTGAAKAATLTDDRLADYAANHAKYQAVILASGDLGHTVNNPGGTTSYLSALTDAEWAALAKFERTFGIRRLSDFTAPSPLHGLTSAACRRDGRRPASATLTAGRARRPSRTSRARSRSRTTRRRTTRRSATRARR